MTTLDPTHIPSRSHPSRGAAVYDLPSSRRLLPVPDLRFEQSYLKSIARYIHRLDQESDSQLPHAETNSGQAGRTEEKGQREEVIEDEALVSRLDEPASKDLYSIEWGRVGYITVRDQVIMPLIQGLVW